MKSIFSPIKGGSIILALVLIARADYTRPEQYAAVPCPLSTLHIIDWGKCRRAGDAWDCPQAHLEFRTDCLMKKPKGKVEFRMNIDRPTVVEIDPKDMGTESKN